jgi:Uma2 family endonuclease
MNWQEICEHPTLRELPFKVETNQWGKIEMCPASNEHGLYQALLISWLARLSESGRPISECSVKTSKGVKVADVAWGSFEFFKKNKRRNPYLESPEIVVEIISPSNTVAEMQEKKSLYFNVGAQEFWLCDQGNMRFFNQNKELEFSELIKTFPNYLELNFA